MKNPEELASEYAKVTASDIPGRERTIGENPCLKRAFIAGYEAAQLNSLRPKTDVVGDALNNSAARHAVAVLGGASYKERS